jgi:hypothetical protein
MENAMTEDALSFLDGTPAPEPQPAPAPEPEVVAEVQADKGEETATPPVAQETEKGVPIAALLDEREKRQKAEREAEEYRRKVAAYEAQAKPAPKIDVLDDPEGFVRQQQAILQQTIIADRYERSRYAAEEKHGKEKVAQVIDFFNDPMHAPKSQEFIRHPDPIGAALRYYEEQQELTRIRTEGGLSAYEAKLREQIKAELLADVQSGTPKPATPPPSLSSAAASGATKAPPINGFDAAFGA